MSALSPQPMLQCGRYIIETLKYRFYRILEPTHVYLICTVPLFKRVCKKSIINLALT